MYSFRQCRVLKQEYESGRKMLADLQARQRELEATLLRIDGAIQVLEELMVGETAVHAAPPVEDKGETAV